MAIYLDYEQVSGGLRDLTDYYHEHGFTVVEARGTFDVALHEGHLDFLERAKYLGGINSILMVNVNNNRWVKGMKKYEGTVLDERERARRLTREDMIDYVIVHPATHIHPAVSLALEMRPDIFVREDKDPEYIALERELLSRVPGYNPMYVALPRSGHEISTSEIMDRVKRKEKRKEILRAHQKIVEDARKRRPANLFVSDSKKRQTREQIVFDHNLMVAEAFLGELKDSREQIRAVHEWTVRGPEYQLH